MIYICVCVCVCVCLRIWSFLAYVYDSVGLEENLLNAKS